MKSIMKSLYRRCARLPPHCSTPFQPARRNCPIRAGRREGDLLLDLQQGNLPLFVQYDYVGMKRIAEELGVKVIVAGPTDFDLPGFIAAVDQVCAQKPSGVSVVGGWDPSLTESVKKCMEQGVPTVVDDGDLPDSGRLAYIGTNWTQVGVAQAKKMMEMLPNGGKLA